MEVFGQRKLLKWSVPGAAHFFVFWAFVILGSVYVEAYGALFSPDFHIPVIGTWPIVGFAQDFIAVMCLFGIVTFAVLRVQQSPQRLGRKSRFDRSHTGGAWLVLFMIFNVLWTLFFFRSAASALGNLPYDSGAFISIGLGNLLDGLSHTTLEVMEGVGLLLHIGVMLVFLIDVLHSKHLHIFLAPLNVLFKRQPVALGSAKPLMNAGKPVTLDDIDDLDEDDTLGVGSIEDFSWKGLLDFNTCTECGRCQDQCPAWNTEKPLSPKLLIMALRDHAMAKGPYSLAPADKRAAMLEGSDTLVKETERPLVGDTGDEWFYMPEDGSGVIDPDVLWSCVTCGACVQQCPVDIEHVDHIVDMRRYQVLVESNFPAELNQLFKGMENKGNPWNLSASARLDWAKDLPFEVKVVGDSIESLDEVDWLFWVGCAGAYEDRAKKTTRAVAELLDLAGVSFGVLGNGETCTGDSARRAGNEFLFQGLAQQNVETFKEHKVKKVVSTCAHCFNTLKNEYKEFGIELEVVHHTQLLNRLVREGKLTPVAEGAGAAKRSITYHDPCYIGRHNQVYEPPRELLQVMPGAEFTEMPRNSERSFCCGAGGARMWMEENLGSRINVNRTKEAVATGADQIAVGCPFCRVMLSDGLTAEQADGNAREEVEVLDVAQMLLASVKGESATKARKAASNGAPAAAPAEAKSDEATKDEPEPGDATQTEETVTETAEVGAAAKASGGSSLFDVEEDTAPEPTAAKTEAEAEKPQQSGGSLFDIGGDAEEPRPSPSRAEPPERRTRPRRSPRSREVAHSSTSRRTRSPRQPRTTLLKSLRRLGPSRSRRRHNQRPHRRRRPPPRAPRSPKAARCSTSRPPRSRLRAPSRPRQPSRSRRTRSRPRLSRLRSSRPRTRPRPTPRPRPPPAPRSPRAARCSTSRPPRSPLRLPRQPSPSARSQSRRHPGPSPRSSRRRKPATRSVPEQPSARPPPSRPATASRRVTPTPQAGQRSPRPRSRSRTRSPRSRSLLSGSRHQAARRTSRRRTSTSTSRAPSSTCSPT